MTTTYQRPQNELCFTYDNVRSKVQDTSCACIAYTHETKDKGNHILKNPWIYHSSGNGVRPQHCVGILCGKHIFKHVHSNVFKLVCQRESWSQMHKHNVCLVRGERCACGQELSNFLGQSQGSHGFCYGTPTMNVPYHLLFINTYFEPS